MRVTGSDRRRPTRTAAIRVRVRDVLILARGGRRHWMRLRPVGLVRRLDFSRTPPSCTGSSGQYCAGSMGAADPSGRYAVRRMQPSSRGVGRRVHRALGYRTIQLHSRCATTRQPTIVFSGSFVPSAPLCAEEKIEDLRLRRVYCEPLDPGVWTTANRTRPQSKRPCDQT